MTQETTEDPAYYLTSQRAAGVYNIKHELLHPETMNAIKDVALTETQYFGFNIPEHRVHGMVYLWWHPHLRCVSGGVWAFQGIKSQWLASEILDWRNWMSDDVVRGDDLHDYRLPNGLRGRMIEPGQVFHFEYEDEARGNRLDLEFTGLMPVYMWAENSHFEQTVRTRGSLRLRGKDYEVDGFAVRDRSFDAVRSEAPHALLPLAWMSGVFDENFSFCATAFDHPDTVSHITGLDELPAGQTLAGGYVRRDGETIALVSCEKRTTRDPHSLYPTGVEMTLTDETGRSYELHGEVIAACEQHPWANMSVVICLTRWECDGRIGHGDVQDTHWTDFVYASLHGEGANGGRR